MSNNENYLVWKRIPIAALKQYAAKSGIDNCCDLEIIAQQAPLLASRAILDVGAGYGRAIDFLVGHDYHGEIHAIEHVPEYIGHIQDRFGEQVNLHEGDVNALCTSLPSIDMILWLFSGFLEFNFEEQEIVVGNLYNTLNQRGVLVIDTPKSKTDTNATKIGDVLELDTGYGIIKGYFPDHDYLSALSARIGFSQFDVVGYQTVTQRDRCLYFLTKNSQTKQ